MDTSKKTFFRTNFENDSKMQLEVLKMEASNVEDLLEYAREFEPDLAIKIRWDLIPIVVGLMHLVVAEPQAPDQLREETDQKESTHEDD